MSTNPSMLPLVTAPTGDTSKSVYIILRTEHIEATEPEKPAYHVKVHPEDSPRPPEGAYYWNYKDSLHFPSGHSVSVGLKLGTQSLYPSFEILASGSHAELLTLRNQLQNLVGKEMNRLIANPGSFTLTWKRDITSHGGKAEIVVDTEYSMSWFWWEIFECYPYMFRPPQTQIGLTAADMPAPIERQIRIILRTDHDQPNKPTHPTPDVQIIPSNEHVSARPTTPDQPWYYPRPTTLRFGRVVAVGVQTSRDTYPKYRALCVAAAKSERDGLPEKARVAVGERVLSLMEKFEKVSLEWSRDGDGSSVSVLATVEYGRGTEKRYVWWEILEYTVQD
ncbi:hypothetical protein EK21DRAFT_88639 [Setomelanomma holmii]|uniref:Uncharacterized protein n=1 Tax=Setomelanomma holmii TaxID=210430 RepID=A0A9P4LMB1_9PLEO|nr:hypothetical protein EK21DRAFT_88639 [Setomelanomma holmii]